MEKRELDNGMKVYTEEKSIELSSAVLLVDAGEYHEDQTQSAHLVEHMQKRRIDDYDREGDLDYAPVNALTSPIYTGYYQGPVLLENFNKNIESLASTLESLNIKEFDTEKQGVLNDLNRKTHPANELRTKKYEFLFPNYSSLTHSLEEELEGTKNIEKEDCRHFFNEYYQPENSVLYLVGGLPDNWEEALEPFKNLEPENNAEFDPIVYPDEPPLEENKELEYNQMPSGVGISFGYQVPNYDRSDGDIRSTLAHAVLLDYLSETRGPLYQALRYDKGICYSLDTRFQGRGRKTDLSISFDEVKTLENAEKVEKTLNNIIEDIAESGLPEGEVETFRKRSRVNQIKKKANMNEPKTDAAILAREIYQGTDGEEILEAQKELAPEDLQRAAENLAEKNYVKTLLHSGEEDKLTF